VTYRAFTILLALLIFSCFLGLFFLTDNIGDIVLGGPSYSNTWYDSAVVDVEKIPLRKSRGILPKIKFIGDKEYFLDESYEYLTELNGQKYDKGFFVKQIPNSGRRFALSTAGSISDAGWRQEAFFLDKDGSTIRSLFIENVPTASNIIFPNERSVVFFGFLPLEKRTSEICCMGVSYDLVSGERWVLVEGLKFPSDIRLHGIALDNGSLVFYTHGRHWSSQIWAENPRPQETHLRYYSAKYPQGIDVMRFGYGREGLLLGYVKEGDDLYLAIGESNYKPDVSHFFKISFK